MYENPGRHNGSSVVSGSNTSGVRQALELHRQIITTSQYLDTTSPNTLDSFFFVFYLCNFIHSKLNTALKLNSKIPQMCIDCLNFKVGYFDSIKYKTCLKDFALSLFPTRFQVLTYVVLMHYETAMWTKIHSQTVSKLLMTFEIYVCDFVTRLSFISLF